MEFGRQRLDDFHGAAFLVELDGDAVSDRQAFEQVGPGEAKKYRLVEIRGEDPFSCFEVQLAERAGDGMKVLRCVDREPGRVCRMAGFFDQREDNGYSGEPCNADRADDCPPAPQPFDDRHRHVVRSTARLGHGHAAGSVTA